MRRIDLETYLAHLDAEIRPRPLDAKKRKPPAKRKKPAPPLVASFTGRTKLTDQEVAEIRQLRAYGLSYREIQDKFDDRPRPPSLTAINFICRGLRRVR